MSSGEFFVQLRTVLFLLPEMREEVDQTFIQEFLELDRERVLINWLKELKDQNGRYQELLSTSGFSKQDFETLSEVEQGYVQKHATSNFFIDKIFFH